MCAWKSVKIRVMWPHEKCGGMTRFLCGDGVRGGLWFVVGAVRGRMGSRLSVVRGCLWFEAGSRRAAVDSLRAALSSARKVEDARMGLVVPPNRLRAAFAARHQPPRCRRGRRERKYAGWFEAGGCSRRVKQRWFVRGGRLFEAVLSTFSSGEGAERSDGGRGVCLEAAEMP